MQDNNDPKPSHSKLRMAGMNTLNAEKGTIKYTIRKSIFASPLPDKFQILTLYWQITREVTLKNGYTHDK